MGGIHERARIRDVTLEQPNHAWEILIFFLMIAFSTLKVAVKPAIEKPTAVPQSRAVHLSESLPMARHWLCLLMDDNWVSIRGLG